MLCCTAGVGPKGGAIDVIYVGSIVEDIYRNKPVSAGVTDLSSIKVGHTLTTPLFMEYFLQRMGLHELLNDLGLDFVIGDTLVQGKGYFTLSRSMGYGLKNVEGIRFGLCANIKDSLTMDDQIRFTLLKERSDILWVIDPRFLKVSPCLIKFYVRERSLSDTSMSPLKTKIDTTRLRKITDFRNKVDKVLDHKIDIRGRTDNHIFSVIAARETLDIIVYPPAIFTRILDTDSLSLRSLMETVAFEARFRRTEMDSAAIVDLCAKNRYSIWGKIKKRSAVLVPDTKAGRRLFDHYHEGEWNEN